MATAQYFDSRTGRELSKWEATDARGIIYPGIIVRTRMTARDSASDIKRRVTDGSNKPFGLHQPGFRFSCDDSLDNTLTQVALADAYRAHENYLNSAWRNPTPVTGKSTTDTLTADDKVCPDCSGNGFDEDGATCPTCQGEGTVEEDDDDYGDAARRVDHRTSDVDTLRRTHARRMETIYDQVAETQRTAYRSNK